MSNSRVVKTYDPKKIIITLGAIIFTDFAEGDFVEITGDDGFEQSRGADGSVNRTNKNVDNYDVNINLSQTSITNDALSAKYKADKLNNLGISPLTIKDLNGTTLFYSAQAWIKKLPDTTDGDTMGSRQWNLHAANCDFTVGGNL